MQRPLNEAATPETAESNPYQAPAGKQAASKRRPYLTAPIHSEKMPPGVPYIVGNEAAERFSFYGMKTILFVFMTEYLMGRSGQLEVMNNKEATSYFHFFVFAVYLSPLLGALLSDVFLGKYRTIISLSIVYCFGHLALALDETRLGLFTGLTLIALGAGGIKPCVSANVGDQFGKANENLIERVFGWFYFAINFGSFFSTLLTPLLLSRLGPRWAFGVPGVLMLLATIVFWLGRRKFVHVPPGGISFLKEAVSGEGLRALGKLSIIYAFIAVFWSLYDQTGSAWVHQAGKMDRWVSLEWLRNLGVTSYWLPGAGRQAVPEKFEVLASQIQAINPLLIMTFMPLFSYVIYPLLNRVIRLTPLRKISIGFFLTVAAFSISAFIEQELQRGATMHVEWQALAYAVLTAAEVMVSITVLEFSYTQAPRKMKSFVMSLAMLSVSLGNLFTSIVNKVIQNPDGTSKLSGADYYWFFTGLMFAAACIFILVAATYRERTYIQESA
ncbi:MAG TPA: POT family MFS transporter [Pirellulales bacterium]|nr:POT family MFS transporter [Pirellulales bacterium]